jgi:hypothetical protein
VDSNLRLKLLIALDRLNAGVTLKPEVLDPEILDLPLFQVGDDFDFYPICLTESEAIVMAEGIDSDAPLDTPKLEVRTTSLRLLLAED